MAFKKYSNAPMPSMPSLKSSGSRTFKGIPDTNTSLAWVRSANPSGPSEKDQMAVAKDKAELSKVPSEIARNNADVAYHGAEAAKLSQEEADKKLKNAILFKTVMGHFGGNARNEKEYAGVLGSSSTGYQDPAAEKLTEMGMAPADYAETVKKNAEAKSQFPDTERGLKHMSMFKPGDKDSQGNAIAGADIAKMALSKYKMDPEDPRIDEFVRNFDAPSAEKPSKPSPMMESLKARFNLAKSTLFGGGDDSAGGTPDTRANPPQPGETRVFKDPETPAPVTSMASIPRTDGVAEGSYLKANGQRTHILKGGQWQPITQ